MTETTRRRTTPDAVWAEVRKAWEGGETAGAAAKRYGVGVPALWKRREAEAWKRPETRFGPIEPAQGWQAWAVHEIEAFEGRLATTRELAQDLALAMAGGPLTEAPLWHLNFLLRWRAEHLGPDVARADLIRALEKDQPWIQAIWTEAGKVRPLWDSDRRMMQQHRATWRAEVGLPDGAAPDLP